MISMLRPLLAFGIVVVPAAIIPLAAQDSEFSSRVAKMPGLVVRESFDSSESPKNGACTIEAGQTAANGRLGRAAHFVDGGHLRFESLGRKSAFSIGFWIDVKKMPTEGLAGLFAADAWESGSLHLNLKSDGGIEIAVNGLAASPTTEPESLRPNRWTFLVLTYDAAQHLRLYRNGIPTIDTPISDGMAVTLSPASFGVWHTGGKATRPLDAVVDELFVFDRALTEAEVRSLANFGRGVPERPIDFAAEVRPILQKNCYSCHGPKKASSGLRLDVRDNVLRGGDSGEPVVMPFEPDVSQLVLLTADPDAERAMPPDDRPRLDPNEIKTLSDWIAQGAPWPDALAGQESVAKIETSHWSFLPVKAAEPPRHDAKFVANGNAVDAFVYDALKKNGLEPSEPADRRTLIRRLHLDVLGLPPSPDQIDAFVTDDRPDAWARLVDKTLASSHYGERWATHWLDVIRWGETHGFEVNTPRENAWPYRDYVIRSLNEDKPYDRFLREQLIGDQIGEDVATGFLVASPDLLPGQVGRDEASIRLARADELHEAIVSVGSGVLGLTIGCARCHNHKFDPVAQQDYYKLQAVFAGLQYGDRPVTSSGGTKLPPGGPKAAFAGKFTRPEPTYRLYRGDPMQRRERMAPGVPAVFGRANLPITASDAERRADLAAWLTSSDNPLTARVMVNRVWQHHFGTGLVATPSDFGAMGTPPSHPELLDYLAARFMADGWSLKRLHRSILLSNTYRQSARPNDSALAVDASSRLLWRFPPRRLDLEPIRDSILAAAGSLDGRKGGPGFLLFKPNSNYVRVYDPLEEWSPAQWRRMVYQQRVRMAQDGVFGAFDCPDAGQPAPLRGRSTTAIQALNLFNSTFVVQQAEALAARAAAEAGPELDAQCVRMFRLALGREPSDGEREGAAALAAEHGAAALARALFNSNEFLFLP